MTQQFGSELTGEKQNEMMPPPEVPELGSFSALPPPVAANGASTSTSSGYEQRPDSGIDLDNGVPNVRSYETNGALSEERALYDKLTGEPDALGSYVNARERIDNSIHGAFAPAQAASPSTQDMTPPPPRPIDGLLPDGPTREQPRLDVLRGDGNEQSDLQVQHTEKNIIMEAGARHDETSLQATEFPEFQFRGNTTRVDPASCKRHYSGSVNGDEERPSSRQCLNNDFTSSLSAQNEHRASNRTIHQEPQSIPTQVPQVPSLTSQNTPQATHLPLSIEAATIEPAPSEVTETEPTIIDSAFDDGASASFSVTDTLNSSVSNYRWENGRRYHAYRDGAYWGPNDELHNDQQDIAHKAWTLSIGDRLFKAPLEGNKLQRALDVGTGTGLWAIEFAEMFPNVQVTGTDLSPIQPNWVPPNCMFEIDDVTLEWTFRKNSFDFIHSREMFGSIADWDDFFAQCYAHCKPGGYVECLERGVKPLSDDGTVGPDHFYTLWGQTVLEMGRRWGKGFDAFEIIREKMERAGFVDIVETKMKWPIGGWPKDRALRELGLWNAVRLDTGIEGYVMRLLTHAGGWSYDEVQTFLAKFRACMRDPTIHAYLPGTCVYGRKPLSSAAKNGDVLIDDEGVEFT